MPKNFWATDNNVAGPTCTIEVDNEEHLFRRCPNLNKLYKKYKITTFEEVFTKSVAVDRFKE